MDNANILITGGAGFIGSHIVENLIHKKCNKIRILDNLSTGNKENITPFLKYDNVEFMYGTIENLEVCREAVKGITHICHQAALGSVPRSVNNPLLSHETNVNGFLNILIAAKEEGIKRIVYASSSSVYGDDENLPKKENNVGNVLSPYAATKKINEIYASVFSKCYNMELIGLRYFNVFGPRQNPEGPYAAVIPKFIYQMKNNIRPTINGSGEFSRDFTYVDNVVEANILALFTKNEICFDKVFNIGSGGRITIIQLFEVIKKHMDSTITPIFRETRKGDVEHSNACILNAKKNLNYNPNVTFESGIIKLLV